VDVLSSRILVRPSDLDRSRRFYRDVLGLAVCREFGPPDDPGVVFLLGPGLLEDAADECAAEAVSVLYQPSSRSRLSSMPKWWPISWMTVRRTWPATSCSVPQIAQMAWR
jgi:catechol 2,3-dioxygenase-like lactoylglutathione lyase family enzyme